MCRRKDDQPFDTDIISQITMKRRSALYIVNFVLPVLFFLVLDMASYLISDNGGEKLGFQITVLLAVTVMQLLLNEILPATSNRIPLIGKEFIVMLATLWGHSGCSLIICLYYWICLPPSAIYCIGIFTLMMLSLLETILVMYLVGKDSASQDGTDSDQNLGEDCNKQC